MATHHETIARLAAGRTDLAFELLAAGGSATAADSNGVSIASWCAYYGDVSALRQLLAHGASLTALGDDFGLNAAAFHGHWRLCEFLIEQGAPVDRRDPATGETALHAALSTDERLAHDLVVEVLLTAGADPNRTTVSGAPTGAFMRDCRTRGETPLHRAAAFGSERAIDLLLAAGARLDARDANGDSPLGWASWHLRPAAVLRKLCFGEHFIRPDYGMGMKANLLGAPLRTTEK